MIFPRIMVNANGGCTHAMHRKTRPLNFTFPRQCRHVGSTLRLYTSDMCICICMYRVDFPEALFAAFAVTTSRRTRHGWVATVRETAVKNIVIQFISSRCKLSHNTGLYNKRPVKIVSHRSVTRVSQDAFVSLRRSPSISIYRDIVVYMIRAIRYPSF